MASKRKLVDKIWSEYNTDQMWAAPRDGLIPDHRRGRSGAYWMMGSTNDSSTVTDGEWIALFHPLARYSNHNYGLECRVVVAMTVYWHDLSRWLYGPASWCSNAVLADAWLPLRCWLYYGFAIVCNRAMRSNRQRHVNAVWSVSVVSNWCSRVVMAIM